MLVKRHIDVPFQCKTQSDLLKIKIAKKFTASQLNIIDHILVSINIEVGTIRQFSIQQIFVHEDFSAEVSKQKLYHVTYNIQTTLGKTFMSKCGIDFFEITHPPHSCLLVDLSIIVGGIVCSIHLCSDDDIYCLY